MLKQTFIMTGFCLIFLNLHQGFFIFLFDVACLILFLPILFFNFLFFFHKLKNFARTISIEEIAEERNKEHIPILKNIFFYNETPFKHAIKIKQGVGGRYKNRSR